jgi:hypothetical protein
MKCFKLFLVALSSTFFLVSCSKDELPSFPSTGDYDDGFFVVNEGNATAGSVSFVKSDFSEVANQIFAAENPSESGLGGYVQSIFFDGEKAYIISGSNKITVVNRNTFKVLGRIESGLSNPRHGVVVNGKAYVTNSKTFSYENAATGNTDDYIAVINLSTLQVESTIEMNALADRILFLNNKIYVTSTLYNEGNSLKIINPTTNTIEKTLVFGNSPNSLEANSGKLYVLCSSYTADSELVTVDLTTDEIENTVVLPATLGNALNLNVENSQVYFTVGSQVFASPLNATTISDVPAFTSTATTLYGFTVKNSAIYITDAKNYVSDGQVYVYSTTGNLIYQINVGLNPNGVYFN